MAKRIIFTRADDGGVSVVVPMLEFMGKFSDEQEALSAVRAKSVPDDATNVMVVDETVIPNHDRVFRNAWRQNGGTVEVDMLAARVLQMDRIREVRNRELSQLDKDWTRASGRNDRGSADKLESKRETLRNIPQTFDLSSASDPEQLKALWPPELPQP